MMEALKTVGFVHFQGTHDMHLHYHTVVHFGLLEDQLKLCHTQSNPNNKSSYIAGEMFVCSIAWMVINQNPTARSPVVILTEIV